MNRWIIEYYDNRWYRKGNSIGKGVARFVHTTENMAEADTFATLAIAQEVRPPRLVKCYREVDVQITPTGNDATP